MVAYPGGVDPDTDPSFKKKPDPDSTLENTGSESSNLIGRAGA